jgi:hypothetical protein
MYCNVTVLLFRVTIVAAETQQCMLGVVELHVADNYTTILSVAQKCLCVKFMSPATMKRL